MLNMVHILNISALDLQKFTILNILEILKMFKTLKM